MKFSYQKGILVAYLIIGHDGLSVQTVILFMSVFSCYLECEHAVIETLGPCLVHNLNIWGI